MKIPGTKYVNTRPGGYGVIGNPTHIGLYQATRSSLVAQGCDLQTVPYGTDLHADLSQALRAWLTSHSPYGTNGVQGKFVMRTIGYEIAWPLEEAVAVLAMITAIGTKPVRLRGYYPSFPEEGKRRASPRHWLCNSLR